MREKSDKKPPRPRGLASAHASRSLRRPALCAAAALALCFGVAAAQESRPGPSPDAAEPSQRVDPKPPPGVPEQALEARERALGAREIERLVDPPPPPTPPAAPEAPGRPSISDMFLKKGGMQPVYMPTPPAQPEGVAAGQKPADTSRPINLLDLSWLTTTSLLRSAQPTPEEPRPTPTPSVTPPPTAAASDRIAAVAPPTPPPRPSPGAAGILPAPSPSPAETPSPSDGGTSVSGALDLNRATEEQLAALPGLDPNRARLIVMHRRSIRGFSRVDQLQEVYGISEKQYLDAVPLIRVGAPPPEVLGPAWPTPTPTSSPTPKATPTPFLVVPALPPPANGGPRAGVAGRMEPALPLPLLKSHGAASRP